MKQLYVTFSLLFMLCQIGLMAQTVIPPRAAIPTNINWTTADWTTVGTQTTDFNRCDADPSLCWYNGTCYMLYGRGSLNAGSTGANIATGPTMDAMRFRYSGKLDASFTDPGGGGHYWPQGLWIDPATGIWYFIALEEFNYSGPAHFYKMGLAKSTDQGHNWHFEGDILSQPQGFERGTGAWFRRGNRGIPYFDRANGYFYYMFNISWMWNKEDENDYMAAHNIGIMRCAVADKMAPGKWYNYYNGTWTEPALGGKCSPILNGNHIEQKWALTFNTYLNKYVLISPHANMVAFATDLTTQDWTPFQQFANPSFWFSNAKEYYTLLTDATPNQFPQQTSQTLRFYNFTYYDLNHDRPQSAYFTLTFNRDERTVVKKRKLVTQGVSMAEGSSTLDYNAPGWVDDVLHQIHKTGPWTDGDDGPGDLSYNGFTQKTNVKNSTAQMTFPGTWVNVYARKGPDCGRVDIQIDGENVATNVDCYSSTPQYLQKIYSVTGLAANTNHAVTLVVNRTKNTASSDNYVYLDAMEWGGKGTANYAAKPLPKLVPENTPSDFLNNKAINAKVTASSYFQNGQWLARYYTDGDRVQGFSTYDNLTAQHTEWVQIDIESKYSIDRVDLYSMGSGFPLDFTIQANVGGVWQTLATVTDAADPGKGAKTTYPFTPVTTQLIKVTATKLRNDVNGSYLLRLAEIEVRGSSTTIGLNNIAAGTSSKIQTSQYNLSGRLVQKLTHKESVSGRNSIKSKPVAKGVLVYKKSVDNGEQRIGKSSIVK